MRGPIKIKLRNQKWSVHSSKFLFYLHARDRNIYTSTRKEKETVTCLHGKRQGNIYTFTWKVVDWNIYVSNGKRRENLHVYMESGRLEHLCFSWKETGKFTCLHGKEH